jgi:hypothetical protein
VFNRFVNIFRGFHSIYLHKKLLLIFEAFSRKKWEADFRIPLRGLDFF